MSLSSMGDLPLFISSTFSGMTSTAVTLCFLEMRTARERPTYPVPTTEIFILFLHNCLFR